MRSGNLKLHLASTMRQRNFSFIVTSANSLIVMFALISLSAQGQAQAPGATRPSKPAVPKFVEFSEALKISEQMRYEAASDDGTRLTNAQVVISVKEINENERVLRFSIEKLASSLIREDDELDTRLASAVSRALTAVVFEARFPLDATGIFEVRDVDSITRQISDFELRLNETLREHNANEAERARWLAHGKKFWLPVLVALPERLAKSFASDSSGVALPISKIKLPLNRAQEYKARIQPHDSTQAVVGVRASHRLVATVVPERYELKANVYLHGETLKPLIAPRAATDAKRDRKVSGGSVELTHRVVLERANAWPAEIETKTLTRLSTQAADSKIESRNERLVFVMKRLAK